MKSILIVAAVSALAGAAAAQPANNGEGSPPSEYPLCSHPGQDRCMQHGPGGWHGRAAHHMRHQHRHHSSADGERG